MDIHTYIGANSKPNILLANDDVKYIEAINQPEAVGALWSTCHSHMYMIF